MRGPATGPVPASPAGRGETRTAGRDGLAGSGPSWSHAVPSLGGDHSTVMPDEVIDLLRLSARGCTGSASNACLSHPPEERAVEREHEGPRWRTGVVGLRGPCTDGRSAEMAEQERRAAVNHPSLRKVVRAPPAPSWTWLEGRGFVRRWMNLQRTPGSNRCEDRPRAGLSTPAGTKMHRA